MADKEIFKTVEDLEVVLVTAPVAVYKDDFLPGQKLEDPFGDPVTFVGRDLLGTPYLSYKEDGGRVCVFTGRETSLKDLKEAGFLPL
jgi:hypothetical protein